MGRKYEMSIEEIRKQLDKVGAEKFLSDVAEAPNDKADDMEEGDSLYELAGDIEGLVRHYHEENDV